LKREHAIRVIAGTFVLSSLALGWFVSPYWYLFFQSGLTKWCLMDDILRKLGVAE
jgi:hypothetical protein